MSHFSSNGKQLPDGDSLDGFGSIDVDVTTAGTSMTQTAPPSLPGPNNQPLSFLFWDTGRRITNKRKVRWTFNNPEKWSDWRAVAWYGSGGGSAPQVGATAYLVGASTLTATPIDGAASTFTNGPGGTLAWPYNGNDHIMRTEWGPVTIHAQAALVGSVNGPLVDFSSWIQLIAGGDDNGYFSETDDDIDSLGSGSGVTGIANSGSADFSAAKGSSVALLGGYVSRAGQGDLIGKLRGALAGGMIGKFIDKGDPSPEDILRLKLISESIDLVRGERSTSADAFEALMAAASSMSPQELRRTIVSTQATLKRGQAAMKYLESLPGRKKPVAAKTAAKTRKPTK